MSNPDVCVFCSASGCLTDTVTHSQECPFRTGMWPVDDEDIRRGASCCACGDPFRAGDVTAQVRADAWPASGLPAEVARTFDGVGDVTFTACLPCAALGTPIGDDA